MQNHYKNQPLATKEAEKAEQQERLQNADINNDGGIGGNNFQQAIGDTPPETRYNVRALDLVRFAQMPKSDQLQIAKERKFELKREGVPIDYHIRAKGAMRACLQSGKHDAADAKIFELRDKAKSGSNKAKAGCVANMDDLNHFKHLFTVFEMQKLGKRKRITVGRAQQHLRIGAFRILLTPDYVYTTKVDGRTEVGAVLLLVFKDQRYTDRQLRLLAHMLRELVVQQFPQLGDEKPLERFVVADVIRRRTFTAPKPVDVPKKELTQNMDTVEEVWEQAKND